MPAARAISKKAGARSRKTWICLGLAALVWIVFGQTLTHDFVNYDDKTYVYGNSLVRGGLAPHGLIAAFADTQTGNWHPLTLISHMLDCQLFDLRAGGHHFTNVLLHTAAVLLLFLWLSDLTGTLWRSAFVAAIFAIHPLRVDSVAWIAERKDVLSAVFFVLTLGAYVRYARAPSIGRYLGVSILFACGLMSKPMLVSVPIVLLLLDYWPLERIVDAHSFGRAILEKVPLGVLSLALSIVTFVVQEHSVGAIAQLPFWWRIENAVVSYVIYLWQVFWPAGLAVFYPHPENRMPPWQVVLAALFLIAVTVFAFGSRRMRPYLLVGWLWYLSMLLPVIGIVEVGLQGHADRYTYLPHIGLYFALTWLAVDIAASLPHQRKVLAGAAMIAILALTACSWKQTGYWRNSETLWQRTLAVTRENDVAQTNLGVLLMERKQTDDALAHFRAALEIRSRSAQAAHLHYDLSLALIHGDIGNVLAQRGQVNEALEHLNKAVELQPSYADGYYNIGIVAFQKGELGEAIAQFSKALSIRPNDAGANTALGNALVLKGSLSEAISHYEKALESAPDSLLPLNNLAWLLSTSPDGSLRNGAKAVQLAQKVDRLSDGKNPIFVRTLAAAYAESGQFNDAIETAQRAVRVARDQGSLALERTLQIDVDRYQERTPLRDQSLTHGY